VEKQAITSIAFLAHRLIMASMSFCEPARLQRRITQHEPEFFGEPIMKNRSVMVLGIVLVVLGVLALAYQGITYTKREKILDVGPLQATADREKTIPLPPLVGGLSLAGGIALLIIGAVKSRP
jgi:hypothetical protein